MVHAIHSDNMEDHAERLQQAYRELSRGLNLDLEMSADDPSKPQISINAEARLRDYPPAVGPVPGAQAVIKPFRSPKKSAGTPRGGVPGVPPPWGPERANEDRPPHEQVLQRRQHYCKMLDVQNADKSVQVRAKTAEERAVNRATLTSFETHNHKWGSKAADANQERAIYRELLATVQYRKDRDKKMVEAEKEDGVRLIEETEKKMAWQWHVKREEEKQEKARLAKLWKAAAKNRRKEEAAQKAAVLREEKEVVERMNVGMVPDRRVRRPREECIVAQDAMPLPYRAPARPATRA